MDENKYERPSGPVYFGRESLCPLGVKLRARGEFLLIDSKHLYFKM